METNYAKVYSTLYHNLKLKAQHVVAPETILRPTHPLTRQVLAPKGTKHSTYFVCNLYYQHGFVGFEVS